MKTTRISKFVAILLAIAMLLCLPHVEVSAKEVTSEPFELPINGATGFACEGFYLRSKPDVATNLQVVLPGTAFTLLEESGEYLKVVLEDGTEGYANKNSVMINLPDVIPSIVYECINSKEAMFKSSRKALPEITGNMLYNVTAKNPRFGDEEQYVMPILYPTALKIQAAQTEALENGDCLKIYETYRPYETQKAVSASFYKLIIADKAVRDAINTAPWSMGWFIAQNLSNHQRGVAMDCSLVKVKESETKKLANRYEYLVVTSYTEYRMPTKMHELSPAAKTFENPFLPSRADGWKEGILSSGMLSCEGAQKLQQYCTNQGLSPLPSEWWHFEDRSVTSYGLGKFFLLNGNQTDEDGNFLEVANVTSKIPN